MSETPAPIRNLDDLAASRQKCAGEAAKQLAFLAEFTTPDNGLDSSGRYSSSEIAAASRTDLQFVQSRIELAHTLATRLPLTMAALRAGVIDEYTARQVATATEALSDELAAQVEERMIRRGGR